MSDQTEVTTIRISKMFHDELESLVPEGQSFEDVLWKLIGTPKARVIQVQASLSEIESRNRHRRQMITRAKTQLPKLRLHAGAVTKQVEKTRAELGELDGKPEEISKYAAKKTELEALTVDSINSASAIRRCEKEISGEQGVQEADRKLKLVRYALAKPFPKCPECGSREFVGLSDEPQPRFSENAQYSWWMPRADMWLSLQCSKCGLMFEQDLGKKP
jgi:hypothetical protein